MNIKFSMSGVDQIENIKTTNLIVKRKGESLMFSSDPLSSIKTNVDYIGVEFNDELDKKDEVDFVVERNMFVNALGNMAKEDFVNMKIEEGRLFITNKTKKQKYKISVSANEYVDKSNKDSDFATITVNSDDFFQKVARVKISVAVNDSRLQLNGIFFDFVEKNIMKMVSSDGKRMSIDAIGFESKDDLKGKSIIVPIEFFDVIQKFNSISKLDKISIGILGDGAIKCDMGNVSIQSSLIEGQFPQYHSVLENIKNEKSFEVNSKEFLNNIMSVNIQKSDIKKNIFNIEDKKITISSSENASEADCEFDLLKSDGSVKFACQYPYIVQYINANPSMETTTCFFNTSSTALLFKKDDYAYIIMPMKM